MRKCSTHRGVLVSDLSGKIYHKHLRSTLMRTFGSYQLDTQFGGLAGKSTDLATHVSRTFVAWSRHNQISSAQLFTDIIGAFDSVVRQILTHSCGSLEGLLKEMSLLKMPAEDLRELAEHIWQNTAFDDAGVDRHLSTVVEDVYTSTWLTEDGLADTSITA